MSALAIDAFYQLFTRTVNTGSSPESMLLEKRVSDIFTHLRNRVERERAFNELAAIGSLTEKNNPDRGNLHPRVSQLACRFLNTLPSAVPAPEVGLDPDGEISFEWIVSKNKQLVVSLSPDGLLSYAGIYGRASKHGKEQFDDTVPQEIISAIRRLGTWEERAPD